MPERIDIYRATNGGQFSIEPGALRALLGLDEDDLVPLDVAFMATPRPMRRTRKRNEARAVVRPEPGDKRATECPICHVWFWTQGMRQHMVGCKRTAAAAG